MKFVKAKKPMVTTLDVKRVKFEKKPKVTAERVVTKPPNPAVDKLKAKGKSLLKSQRGRKTQHFYHHCGIQGHTRPNCHKLKALNNVSAQRLRGPRNSKGNWTAKQSKSQEGDPEVRDVMKMIDAFTTCLASFTRRFESHDNRAQS